MCRCANFKYADEREDVQICRWGKCNGKKNVQMIFLHLHICNLYIQNLFSIPIDNIYDHLVLLQLWQVIKQDVMFLRIGSERHF